MTWIYRDADIHKCKLPSLDTTSHPGDLWSCDQCGTIYAVHDDQRDGRYMTKATQEEINWASSRTHTVNRCPGCESPERTHRQLVSCGLPCDYDWHDSASNSSGNLGS